MIAERLGRACERLSDHDFSTLYNDRRTSMRSSVADRWSISDKGILHDGGFSGLVVSPVAPPAIDRSDSLRVSPTPTENPCLCTAN